MRIELGLFPTLYERPEPVKFAYPVVLLLELFTTVRHLAAVAGYLATVGWEIYAPDLRAGAGQGSTPPLAQLDFDDLVALAGQALDAVARDLIVLGYGIGGLLALKMAERPNVRAAVALAPMVPGFASPLLGGGLRQAAARWLPGTLRPPVGRMLDDFMADADPWQRAQLAGELVEDTAGAARQVANAAIELAPATKAVPRLLIAGDRDRFAPLAELRALANRTGARLILIPGRGHWIVGGRALERVIAETQRFLVRALGSDLLLLRPEEELEESDED